MAEQREHIRGLFFRSGRTFGVVQPMTLGPTLPDPTPLRTLRGCAPRRVDHASMFAKENGRTDEVETVVWCFESDGSGHRCSQCVGPIWCFSVRANLVISRLEGLITSRPDIRDWSSGVSKACLGHSCEGRMGLNEDMLFSNHWNSCSDNAGLVSRHCFRWGLGLQA